MRTHTVFHVHDAICIRKDRATDCRADATVRGMMFPDLMRLVSTAKLILLNLGVHVYHINVRDMCVENNAGYR